MIARLLSVCLDVVLVVGILAGCSAAPGSSSASAATAVPPASPTGSAAATASASATARAASPAASPSQPASPPTATLRGGTRPTAGDIGSYSIGSVGSDSPWLPGEPVTVGAGSELVVQVSELEIASWQAVLATAPDVGARALAEGQMGPIVFAAPDAGTWSLRVRIHFPDGDATYYWALRAK